jgi:fatty acid desaturase
MTQTATNPLEHLSDEDLAAIGRELDALREDVLADLGEDDAAYIRRVIAAQRGLEAGGRAALLVSLFPPAWPAGAAMLSVAKILENMEIGHNVLHGQWDWMRDPEIHSANWEWDSASTADAWKHAHNFVHHTYTNVLGKDRDLGYSILRIEPDQPWHPVHLAQPIYIVPMALLFEWAIATYDIELENVNAGKKPWPQAKAELGGLWRKARKQLVKDYVAFPLLSGPRRSRRSSATSPRTPRATYGRTRSSSAGTSPTAPRRSPKSSSRTRRAVGGTSASCSARATSTARRSCTC